MRKLILLPLLLLILAFPLPAAAQENVLIDSLLVEFWPEFDRDEMLVIYRIQLSADLDYPLELRLPMPSAAGDANAVAVPGEAGNLVVAPYELDEQGDWTLVRVTVEAPIVQFEYYDPGLDTSSDQRQFQYQWEGLYPVESFSVQVQQPIGASGMQFAPDLEAPVLGPDNLQYHNGDFGTSEIGEAVALEITYTKEGGLLTSDALNPGGSDPGVSKVAGSVDWVAWIGWGLGIAGVGILIYAAYRWFNPAPRKDTFRQGRRTATGKKSKSTINVFCHNCGTQAYAGDKFCRECGTALRL